MAHGSPSALTPRRDASHHCNIGDLSTVKASKVVRATTASTDAVFHRLKLDVVARLAAAQRLQAVVGCVLENVEWVCHVQEAKTVRFHDFCDVGSATSVSGVASFLVHLREAGHVSHIVNLLR